MDTLTILQHNVAHWKPNRYFLTNMYLHIDPDVILINSHGLKANERIKIYGYNTYIANSSNELHDGSAILIKTQTSRRFSY